MRSRYCAFSITNYKYIIKTTHKENPDYTTNKEQWEKDILSFCNTTQFNGLKILKFKDGLNEAFVTFHATLLSNGQDLSFTEKSKFYKVENRWLYHSGEFL